MDRPGTTLSSKLHVYVAIDFGTAMSGISCAIRTGGSIEPIFPGKYDGSPNNYFKTLTQVAKSSSGETAWGWPAKTMHDKSFDESVSLYKYFKMDLRNSTGLSNDIAGNNPIETKELIAEYLEELNSFLHENWNSLGIGKFEDSVLNYCLTIPAIWEEDEKQVMLDIAEQVGMYDPSNESAKLRFQFALEPEAAATYIFNLMEKQGTPIEDQDTFLIIDCGGGTIDLTAHRLVDNSLEEVTLGSGCDSGSMKLDENFFSYLMELFGSDFFDNLEPEDIASLSIDWEVLKCAITDLDQAKTIKLPNASIEIASSSQVPASLFRNGRLRLLPDVLKKIYNPIFDSIADEVEKQLADFGENFDYMFLVGGFGESAPLKKFLKSRFKSSTNIDFICPPNCGESILRGATILSADQSLISRRRVRRTYGVKCYVPFDSSVHPSDKKMNIRGTSYCDEVFDKFVEIGDQVGIDQKISREYTSVGNSLALEFYESKYRGLEYVDELGCDLIGMIVVTNVSPGSKVILDVGFGRTFLHLVAKNDKGEEFPAQVIFGDTGGSWATNNPYSGSGSNIHLIFCNDISGSMQSKDMRPTDPYIASVHDNRVGALYQCVKEILEPLDGTGVKVSGIVHEGHATIVFQDEEATDTLFERFLSYPANGSNSFIDAMRKVEMVVDSVDEETEIICFFMSDGIWGDEGSSDLAMRLRNTRNFTCHSVVVACDHGTEVLEAIATKGGGQLKNCGTNLNDLVQAYQQLLAGILN